MISKIQNGNQIFAVNSDQEQDEYAKAMEVLSFVMNLENGVLDSLLLTTPRRDDMLAEDRRLSKSLKGYTELKAYVQEKLLRLKLLGKNGISMMTRVLSKDQKAVMLKDHLGGGFSDIVYFVKPQDAERSLERLFTSSRPLYIMTPIDSPFVEQDNFYDTSRMYRVPDSFLDSLGE